MAKHIEMLLFGNKTKYKIAGETVTIHEDGNIECTCGIANCIHIKTIVESVIDNFNNVTKHIENIIDVDSEYEVDNQSNFCSDLFKDKNSYDHYINIIGDGTLVDLPRTFSDLVQNVFNQTDFIETLEKHIELYEFFEFIARTDELDEGSLVDIRDEFDLLLGTIYDENLDKEEASYVVVAIMIILDFMKYNLVDWFSGEFSANLFIDPLVVFVAKETDMDFTEQLLENIIYDISLFDRSFFTTINYFMLINGDVEELVLPIVDELNEYRLDHEKYRIDKQHFLLSKSICNLLINVSLFADLDGKRLSLAKNICDNIDLVTRLVNFLDENESKAIVESTYDYYKDLEEFNYSRAIAFELYMTVKDDYSKKAGKILFQEALSNKIYNHSLLDFYDEIYYNKSFVENLKAKDNLFFVAMSLVKNNTIDDEEAKKAFSKLDEDDLINLFNNFDANEKLYIELRERINNEKKLQNKSFVTAIINVSPGFLYFLEKEKDSNKTILKYYDRFFDAEDFLYYYM